MDNIKFKAKITDSSHLSAGKIVDVDWIDLKNKQITFNGVAFEHGFGELVETAKENQFKLMPFSGYPDMDGNEIYAGHIVRIYDDEENDVGWNESVIFHQGAFFAGDENFIGNVHFRSRIIGDIYSDKVIKYMNQNA
ncbi:hypothetical protein A0U40_09745 [[Bacillus] sp. KCTC 13219]|nr:hypothetical protein A0U40_09745 [[Bacillus] sp. KCTC 13219]